MKKLLIALVILLIPSIAHAEDVVLYNGSVYIGCRSIGDTNIFLYDPNDYSTIKPGFIYMPNGCGSLPSVDPRFLKIVDGQVVEMSQAEKDAILLAEEAANTVAIRNSAKAVLTGFSEAPLYQRAFADIVKDEINALRTRDRDRASDIALATNLANLQTRAAQRPALEDRTLNQLKTAIQNRIDSGSVDA